MKSQIIYTFIYGEASDFDTDLKEYVEEGWVPCGPMNTTSHKDDLIFSVILCKSTEDEKSISV